ncbi:MAG: hypothetical protein GY810_05745 [Aureispira sp.]|nr:hypothetical protein [Aureispira sp.]
MKILIVLVIVIGLIVSCGDKSEPTSTPEKELNPKDTVAPLSSNTKEDTTLIKEWEFEVISVSSDEVDILIRKKGVQGVYQTFKNIVVDNVDLAKIRRLDLNFDNYPDLMIQETADSAGIIYSYWFYDPDRIEFRVPNKGECIKMINPKLDIKNKQLITTQNEKNGAYSSFYYGSDGAGYFGVKTIWVERNEDGSKTITTSVFQKDWSTKTTVERKE